MCTQMYMDNPPKVKHIDVITMGAPMYPCARREAVQRPNNSVAYLLCLKLQNRMPIVRTPLGNTRTLQRSRIVTAAFHFYLADASVILQLRPTFSARRNRFLWPAEAATENGHRDLHHCTALPSRAARAASRRRPDRRRVQIYSESQCSRGNTSTCSV